MTTTQLQRVAWLRTPSARHDRVCLSTCPARASLHLPPPDSSAIRSVRTLPDRQTDRQTDTWTDGRTDGRISTGRHCYCVGLHVRAHGSARCRLHGDNGDDRSHSENQSGRRHYFRPLGRFKTKISERPKKTNTIPP